MAHREPLERWRIAESFAYYDTERCGRVSNAKIPDMLRSLGIVISVQDVLKIKETHPENLSISFHQLLPIVKDHHWSNPTRVPPSDKELNELFDFLEDGGSGTLELRKLRHLLTSVGAKLSSNEFDRLLLLAKLSPRAELLSRTDFIRIFKSW